MDISTPIKKYLLEKLLEQSYDCLLYHLDETYVFPEEQIPRYYIENCHAIIFIIQTSTTSNGILLFHYSKNEWSAPCAIKLELSSNNANNNNDNTEKYNILLIQDSDTLMDILKDGLINLRNYANHFFIYDGPLGRNIIYNNNLFNNDKPLPRILCYGVARSFNNNNNNNSNNNNNIMEKIQLQPKNHYQWLLDYNLVVSNNVNQDYYKINIDPDYIEEINKTENFMNNKIPHPNHNKYYCYIVYLLNKYIEESSNFYQVIEDIKNKIQNKLSFINNTSNNNDNIIDAPATTTTTTAPTSSSTTTTTAVKTDNTNNNQQQNYDKYKNKRDYEHEYANPLYKQNQIIEQNQMIEEAHEKILNDNPATQKKSSFNLFEKLCSTGAKDENIKKKTNMDTYDK